MDIGRGRFGALEFAFADGAARDEIRPGLRAHAAARAPSADRAAHGRPHKIKGNSVLIIDEWCFVTGFVGEMLALVTRSLKAAISLLG
jgi:hypothetical protein